MKITWTISGNDYSIEGPDLIVQDMAGGTVGISTPDQTVMIIIPTQVPFRKCDS